MSAAILAAYVLGVTLGLLAARSGRFGRVWPTIVRTQIVVAAAALSVASVWGIEGVAGILWPTLMMLAICVLFLVSYLTCQDPPRAARSSLQAWAANANTSFFVIPVAAALAGPEGAAAAVLMDRLAVPLYALWTHLLRREAALPQRRHTSVIDQAPLIAVLLGLLLRLAGPAPEWTNTVTLIAAPVLAASGAAVYLGSVLHHTQRLSPRPGFRRWLTLVAVRVVAFTPLAVLAPTDALRIVAVLCALSVPAFAASQASVLYGFADPVVSAASRYGWIVGAIGLVVTTALGTRVM